MWSCLVISVSCDLIHLVNCYIDVVGRIAMEMGNRPLVIPDLFMDDKIWEEWIDHLKSVADMSNWDNAKKLKWLCVRLGGRASTVF